MVGGQSGCWVCRPGVVLGDMPKGTLQPGDTLWVKNPLGTCGGGGPVPCPWPGGAFKATTHQGIAGPEESCPGPQGGVGGGRSGATPQRGVGPHRHHAMFPQAPVSPPQQREGQEEWGAMGAPQEGAHSITGGS